MSLYVCGDTHGGEDLHKLTSKRFHSKNLTKQDYVLICGDCGVVWDLSATDFYLRKWYRDKPWTTLFVDGNHENHDLLASFPVTQWNGGKVHVISDSIIHLMRGQVYDIDGHTLFTMGGASSHDKQYRKAGISWWEAELPSPLELAEARANLAAHQNSVEYIVTHCASNRVQDLLNPRYEKNLLTAFLDELEEINYQHWYFGHYHTDRAINETHTALFDRVIKLW